MKRVDIKFFPSFGMKNERKLAIEHSLKKFSIMSVKTITPYEYLGREPSDDQIAFTIKSETTGQTYSVIYEKSTWNNILITVKYGNHEFTKMEVSNTKEALSFMEEMALPSIQEFDINEPIIERKDQSPETELSEEKENKTTNNLNLNL